MSSSPCINSEPAVNFDPTKVKTEVMVNGDGSILELHNADSTGVADITTNGEAKMTKNGESDNVYTVTSNGEVKMTKDGESDDVNTVTTNGEAKITKDGESDDVYTITSNGEAKMTKDGESDDVNTITSNGEAKMTKDGESDDVYTITTIGDSTIMQLTKKDGTITLEPSKYSIRKEMWKNMDKNGLVSYPRPCRGRIPNFRSAREAADKLKETEAFKNAQVVKVNTDKPQEMVRFKVLENKKKLVVSPRRTDESSSQVEVKLPSEDITSSILRKSVSSFGMRKIGQAIDWDTPLKIDLIVVGSVAVSRTGQRIGKCDGFSDLEFGYLTEIGAITEDTIVATTVHDSQVFETLPEQLFCEHDIPLDLIVTPTEVIQVANRPARPSGIIWSLLSKRRMALCPKVAVLHQKLVESGKEVHLKEEDTDAETERDIRRKHQPWQFHSSPYPRNTRKSESKRDGENSSGSDEKKTDEKLRKRRPKRPRKDPNADSSDKTDTDRGDKAPEKRRAPLRRFRVWRPLPISFSIRVGGIAPSDTVRDLKNALAERNLKPAEISWFGPRGFAFVHFAKPRKEPEVPVELETVMASLQDMKIGQVEEGKEKAPVVVRPATSVQERQKTVVADPKIVLPSVVLSPIESVREVNVISAV